MIRSSTVTLKFSNTGKKEQLSLFLSSYSKLVGNFVDILWDQEASKFPSKEVTGSIETTLSARIRQCAAKQAAAVVRGTKKKLSQREWRLNQLDKEGNVKGCNILKNVIDKNPITKPTIDVTQAELDSRFVHIDLNNATQFDGWLTLSSLGNKLKLKLPFKRTKHFNKLHARGSMLAGVRVSASSVTFMFEVEQEVPLYDRPVGLDIGQKTTISCSNGQCVGEDPHGHTYQSICNVLARKRKGSKSFARTSRQRTNYLNWCVNQLSFNTFSTLRLEDIKNMRKGKRQRRAMSSWNYAELFSVLERKAEEHGVHVVKVSPTFTSKRCSHCGYTADSNRKAKLFKCRRCGFAEDADMNAAINLSLPLKEIPYRDRCMYNTKLGFLWACGSEIIVPDVNKTIA